MTANDPRALVLLAEGAEEMEVTIIVDVLRRAEVQVVLAGVAGADPVTCSRGVRIVPDRALASVDGDFELVVMPGGLDGTNALAASSEVGALLHAQFDAGRPIGAICAAPMALAKHGVGAGLAMTCHPSVEDAVAAHASITVGRVVETPPLITSQGPGTAFEFALALVTRLKGVAVAAKVREPMILPG